MMLPLYYTLLASLLLLSSCHQQDGEKAIAERERAVEQREQRMTLVEDDYRALLEMRDSLRASNAMEVDSTSAYNASDWPASVQGEWNSRMICRSSRCTNYVIGDQRNELWRFYSDSTGSYVQVVNNNEPTRIFKGKYAGQKITLKGWDDSTATTKFTMRVELDDIDSAVMKGTQIITDQNNCEAVFSVELTPREK